MSTITEAKKQQYELEISNWNWDKVVQLAKDDPQEDPDSGNTLGYCYLGTVFGLTPSGKIYTPFANSNVALCPRCNGQGQLPNQMSMPLIYAKLRELDGKLRKLVMGEFGAYCEGRWPQGLNDLLHMVSDQAEAYRDTHTCPNCDGLGSEEARWDELFTEALEEAAVKRGGFIDMHDENIYFAILIAEASDDQTQTEGEKP